MESKLEGTKIILVLIAKKIAQLITGLRTLFRMKKNTVSPEVIVAGQHH